MPNHGRSGLLEDGVAISALLHSDPTGVFSTPKGSPSPACGCGRAGASAEAGASVGFEGGADLLLLGTVCCDSARSRIESTRASSKQYSSLWCRRRRSSYARRSFAWGTSVLVPGTDCGPRVLSLWTRAPVEDRNLSVGFRNVAEDPGAHDGALFSKSSSMNTPSADCGADCSCINGALSG